MSIDLSSRTLPDLGGRTSVTIGPMTISDPVLLDYLLPAHEADRPKKLLEAAKAGVVAILSASTSLDTKVVDSKFAEFNSQVQEKLAEFVSELGDYFKSEGGLMPRTLEGFLGENGKFATELQRFFHPKGGKLAEALAEQIGPSSAFARTVDPRNSEGLLAQIVTKVRDLVETRMTKVLTQFSLDDETSAMSRLRKLLNEGLQEIRQAVGELQGRKVEAEKGHVKGNDFQAELYRRLAEWCYQLEDDCEFVHATPGADGKCKKGDHLIVLGATSGAPNEKIVVEVKDNPSAKAKLRDVLAELQKAKENRGASIGICVFSKGAEPEEVVDGFRKFGNDFVCSVDKDEVDCGGELLGFKWAYKIARTIIVAKAQATDGEFNVQQFEEDVGKLAKSVAEIAGLITQARTVENNGKKMREGLECAQQTLNEGINRLKSLAERK